MATDLKRIVIGTAQIGLDYGIANRSSQMSEDEAKSILEYAEASGITSLDTAIAYGSSESRLGRIGIRNWQVVSKAPAMPVECADISTWLLDSLLSSLSNLKIERVYGFLLHQPKDLWKPGGDQLYKSLLRLKADGRVQKIGISIYDPQELNDLCPKYHFDIVQLPFNILDDRLIKAGWLSRLKDAGIEIYARSVFLQGLLLSKTVQQDTRFGRWATTWACWQGWLEQQNLSALEACLRYVLSFRQIDRVIVGVDSLSQLREIIASLNDVNLTIPPELHVDDVNLVNPANWKNL